MKKQYGVVALACLLASATSVAADDGASIFSFENGVKYYAGGSIGMGVHDTACSTEFFSGDCDDSDLAMKVYGGARLNPMFGVEAAYASVGESEKNGQSTLAVVSSENKVSGFQLSGVGYFPVLTENLPGVEVMAKGGLMFWQQEGSMTQAGNTTKVEDSGISPLFGLGVQYQLMDNVQLRSEYEHISNTGDESAFKTDINLYSIGVNFNTL